MTIAAGMFCCASRDSASAAARSKPRRLSSPESGSVLVSARRSRIMSDAADASSVNAISSDTTAWHSIERRPVERVVEPVIRGIRPFERNDQHGPDQQVHRRHQRQDEQDLFQQAPARRRAQSGRDGEADAAEGDVDRIEAGGQVRRHEHEPAKHRQARAAQRGHRGVGRLLAAARHRGAGYQKMAIVKDVTESSLETGRPTGSVKYCSRKPAADAT